MPGDFEAVMDRLKMPWPVSVRVVSPHGPMLALQLSMRETADLARALVAVLDADGLAAVEQAITERRAAITAELAAAQYAARARRGEMQSDG